MSLLVDLLWDAHNLIIAEFGALFTNYIYPTVHVQASLYAPCSTTTSSAVFVDNTWLHAPALKRWVCAIAAVRARGVHYCTGYVDHGVGLGHSLRHIEFL